MVGVDRRIFAAAGIILLTGVRLVALRESGSQRPHEVETWFLSPRVGREGSVREGCRNGDDPGCRVPPAAPGRERVRWSFQGPRGHGGSGDGGRVLHLPRPPMIGPGGCQCGGPRRKEGRVQPAPLARSSETRGPQHKGPIRQAFDRSLNASWRPPRHHHLRSAPARCSAP